METNFIIARDLESFEALINDWDRMVSEKFDGNPFFGHFWYLNYYRSYFPKKSLLTIALYRDDKMVAVLPLVLDNQRMAGIPLKRARLIVGPQSHINQILVAGDQQDLYEPMLDRLLSEGVDLVYFEDLAVSAPVEAILEQFCQSRNLNLEVRQVRSSPYIPTVGYFTDYRQQLSKKFNGLLNNRMNRINKAGGFAIKTYCDGDDFDLAVDAIDSIGKDSWQGKNNSGLFSGKDNTRFYRSLIRHSFDNNYGKLFVLYFEEKPAGYEFHIYHGKTEYCLKGEYSQQFERVSPGAVLDLELVKGAFASDIETYDLLGFADSYKLRWTKNLVQYQRYFIFGRSAASRVAYILNYRIGNRLRNSKLLRRLRGKKESGSY